MNVKWSNVWCANDPALDSHKALYGVKQAGHLWSKLLYKKLDTVDFSHCLTDTCVYWKCTQENLVVVGVYVDDLRVTATKLRRIEYFLVT